MEFNIADLFEGLADAIPERPALVSGARRLTFAELDARANRARARALPPRHPRRAITWASFSTTGTSSSRRCSAAFKIRAVPININYRYVEEELAYLLANADLVALARTAASSCRGPIAVRDRVPTLRTIDRRRGRRGHGAADQGALEYGSLLGPRLARVGASSRARGATTTSSTPAARPGCRAASCGSTKTCSSRACRAATRAASRSSNPRSSGRSSASKEEPLTFLPAAPFIHGAAQWAALIGWFGGGKVVLSPGRSFDARSHVRAHRARAGQHAHARRRRDGATARRRPPRARSYDMSSLVVIVSAGAILSDAVKDELQEQLPNTMILNNFGATETGHQGMVGFGEPRGGKPDVRDGRDEHRPRRRPAPIAPGSGIIGKLARRGHLPVGYYKDPEKTAATFVTIDGERVGRPRRPRHDRGGRTHHGLRPRRGVHQHGRREGLPRGGGGRAQGAPRRGRRRGRRRARRASGASASPPSCSRVPAPTSRCEPVDAHCRSRIAGYKVPRQLALVEQPGPPPQRQARLPLGGRSRRAAGRT